MNHEIGRLTAGLGTVIGGLLFFAASMGLSLGSTALNARYAPEVPWFVPIVAIIAVGGARWAHGRWNIGLTLPAGVAWGRIWILGIAATIGGVCVCVLQGAHHGLVRNVESGPEGMPAVFTMAYAFVIPVAVAVIAETSFRGIMQTGLQRVLPVWPAIALVAAINTVSHRWEEFIVQWLGLFVSLAGLGYLRHASRSLIPPLTAHLTANLLLALVTWIVGPLRQADMGPAGLGATTILAAASYAVAVRTAMRLKAG